MKTLSLLILAVLPALGAADDWPNWRGPDHDGISKEKGWRTELGDPEWRVKVGIGFSSVAVAGGRLYTLGHDGKKQGGQETVYCLDAKTGKEIWTFSYAAELMPFLHEGGPLSTPAVDGGHVYTIGKGGQFYCFDAETGKPAWEKDLFALTKPAIKTREWWGYAPSPLILGDLVIVESGATLAFDKKTGEEKWRSKMYVPAYGTPAAFTRGGKARLAVLKTDGLAVLDAADGKTLAFQEWTTSYRTSAATPIIAGDQIFLSTGYGTGCGLYRFTGSALEEIYTNKEMANHMANCVLIGGHLYGIHGNTHGAGTKDLRCMEFATGKVAWTKEGFGVGSLIGASAGEHLLVLGESGELAAVKTDPQKFAELSRTQASSGKNWTNPVLANGRIYCRNAAGDLSCLNANAGE